jgi:type IV pilus assembly protein PilA
MKNVKELGFTLVELLAVIIILGIVLVIAVPGISSIINNATKSAFVIDAKQILKQMEIEINNQNERRN